MRIILKDKLEIIASEFRRMYYSNLILYFLLSILAMIILIFYMNYKEITLAYEDYTRVQDLYENEEDMKEDLEINDYNMVENPISYYNEQLKTLLFVNSPDYTLTQIFEAGIIFFPIIFGIFGLLLGCADYKTKIIKHKVARVGRKNYYLSKISTSMITILFFFLIMIIISKIAGIIMYNVICNKIPVNNFSSHNLSLSSNVLVQFIFMYFISIVYSSIGMLIGVLTKGAIRGVVLIAAYAYAVPVFSKFDLKNSYYFIMDQLCDFYGVIKISGIKDSSILISMIIIMGFLIFTNIATYLVIIKRSAYE